MMSDDPVLVERHDDIALLSFNRPERLNAFGKELRARTIQALGELATDEAVRGIVLTGTGRAFCAGADLKDPDTHNVSDPDAYLDANRTSPIFDVLGHYPKPIMAAVNGYAIGVGCLMPVCCDFIYASEDASFSLPQTRLGLLPAYGGTLRMARFIGQGNALNMALTGRKVGALEAQRLGLVVEVLPAEELVPRAIEAMQAIAKMPVHAVRLTRESLRLGYDSGLPANEQADLYRIMALYQTNASHEQHKDWRS